MSMEKPAEAAMHKLLHILLGFAGCRIKDLLQRPDKEDLFFTGCNASVMQDEHILESAVQRSDCS